MSPNDWKQWACRMSLVLYTESVLGFQGYAWQLAILRSGHKRKLINGARQAGKSTVVSARPCWRARFYPGSLSIIIAATEKQSIEDRRKVTDFIAHDPDYPGIVRQSDQQVELINGSRIIVVPATEKSARGYSAPDLIVLDEAARIEEVVYRSGVRPMLVDNPNAEMIVISTPFGRDGFFWRAWQSKRWERFEIRAPWDAEGPLAEIVPPALTEKQYRQARAKEGIRAWYSPRHHSRSEREEDLGEMGLRLFRQEMLVEFVERQHQVFGFEQIQAMFDRGGRALDWGTLEETEVPALELDIGDNLPALRDNMVREALWGLREGKARNNE